MAIAFSALTADSIRLRSLAAAEEAEIGNEVGPQEAYTAILRHFVNHGRAPHYVELAEILGVDIEAARTLQREAAAAAPASTCWLAHDTDYVEAWGPFSNVPTHVRISVEGTDRWFGL